MSSRKQMRPPRHGVIHVTSLKPEHARKHLAAMTTSAAEVRDYNTGGVTGQNSQGAMSPGGASSADYQTTNTGNTGDADSGGAS
jgi:hypothetical protein